MWGGFILTGVIPFTLVALTVFVSNPTHLGSLIVLVFTLPILALWLCTRTVIEDGHLSDGFFFRPRSISLTDVVEVKRGRVGWGQGSVDGLVAVRTDGTEFQLRLSPFLSKERAQEWRELILSAAADSRR